MEMINDCFSVFFKFLQLVYFGYSISPFCVLFKKYQVTITPETNLICCICYMTTSVTCKSMVKHPGLCCTLGSKWFMLIVFLFTLLWFELASAGLFFGSSHLHFVKTQFFSSTSCFMQHNVTLISTSFA